MVMELGLGLGSDRVLHWPRWFRGGFHVAQLGGMSSVHSFVVGRFEAVTFYVCPTIHRDPFGFEDACESVCLSKLWDKSE